jgi:N-methylhydantoinase B
LVESALQAIAWEMCSALVRTAYSPNIKERADCSTALCDAAGRTLTLATHAPAHLGSTLRAVPAVLERFPLESLAPGDVFLANDPYIVGVTHLNDCTLITPVFADDVVVAFALSVAHQSDVGGRVPGSEAGDSRSIFQEGLRLPPIRLFRAGERQTDIWELFLLNSRTPEFSNGDLYAQLAAVNRGVERVQGLYSRHGSATMQALYHAIFRATEARLGVGIRSSLAEGTYLAEDWLDDDGATGRPVRLVTRLIVEDGRLVFDFTETADQLESGKNVPLTHTMATVYYALKMMLDPALSLNEGLFRTVDVRTRPGSVVDPRPPAGVSSRNLTSMILADVLVDALGQAAPQRTMAASGPYQGITLSGGRGPGLGYFVDYENFAGGQGASADADGMDAVQVHMTNTSNLPIESMEAEFPVVVEGYEMVRDSGGAGRFRGGLGVRRRIRILADEAHLALRSARRVYTAEGVAGGRPGARSACVVRSGDGGVATVPPTVSEYRLTRGDVLEITSPGGGGFGDPLERDPAAVLRDVQLGKVTVEAARDTYGVGLSDGAASVDLEATARRRQDQRRVG